MSVKSVESSSVRYKRFCVLFFCLTVTAPQVSSADNWPQAAGPNADWKTDGEAPVNWSVVRNENIAWRTELPEGGQSSVTIHGDRAFLTCHTPLKSSDEQKTSTDIDGYCLDIRTGKVLWTVQLPGSVAVGTAGIFSDATVFAPVTDGKHVWFFNRSGSVGCFDFSGKQIWLREFVPRNRHTNRQCEPILFGDQIITVEVLDKDAGAKLKRHAPVPQDIDPRRVWTYLHGIDKNTGEVLWTESAGTVCHNTPMLNRMADGTWAVVHARGGGHGPLEKPYGYSLTSLAAGNEGTTLWSTEIAGLNPSFNSHWDKDFVYVFHKQDHVLLDTGTGRELRRRSMHEDVDYRRWDSDSETRTLHKGTTVKVGRAHANTNQANIVAGDCHYFLAHDIPAVGRINVRTGRVEYLQVPVQIDARADMPDRLIRDSRDAIPIETVNSRGINIAPDKRAARTGWGHVSAASPTLVGRYLYMPVMTGTVYVIDTQAEDLDDSALAAVNDLGPAGKTWTLSSFSYADGALYIRTMKDVICIRSTVD